MASYNRVILLGNLTRDLELRYIPSGMAVSDNGIAVNERRKTPSGEWVEDTVFVDITFWGRNAEIACEYLKKGSQVLIEGRLKLDTWEGNDGQKRSKLRVTVDRMTMTGSRAGGPPPEGAVRTPAARRSAAAEYNQAPPPETYEAPPESPGDDIPF